MIIPQAQLNKQLWDQCVLKNKPEGFFFMLSWYLDVVAPNWEGYVIGDYEAIYPVIPQKKLVFQYSIMPFLTRTFYPIGFNTEQLIELSRYVNQRFSYFQLSGFQLKNFSRSSIRQFQILDLSGYTLNKCSENHKRQFKKANKQGFVIKEKANPDMLIQLFRKVKGEEFKHLKEGHYLKLQRLMEEASQRGFLRQFSLFKDEVLIGAAAYLVIDDIALYLKGAIEPAYKKEGAMVFLHLSSIESLGENCKQLDFGGSNAQGLGDFNRKFGAANHDYLHFTQNNLPWPISWFFKSKFGR
jgi:lipid II:glycine glycyltransferase (peptidoglycan interpeptide bridge formation enzyme)